MRTRAAWMIAAVMITAAARPAGASVRIWTGAGTANWGDSASWGGDPCPAAGDTAVFTDAGLPDGCTVALGATREVDRLDLQANRNFTLGDDADVTAGYHLLVGGVGRSNIAANVTHTLATDIGLTAADTVFATGATQGMLAVTGLLFDSPDKPARLVIRGPGTVHFEYRVTAGTTAAHTGGTLVTENGELSIFARGTGNPAVFGFGASPATVTLAGGTLSLRASGGSNAGIRNDVIVDGTGRLQSSHSQVEKNSGRSCNPYGNLYLNGSLNLGGAPVTVSANDGTNSPTCVAQNKTIFIGQTNEAARRVTQHVPLTAPNRCWCLRGAIRDGTGSAGNPLELRNSSPNGQRLLLVDGSGSDYAHGTRVLDDSVPEDLLDFSNAVEILAWDSGSGPTRLGTGPVFVEGGALLALRYNRRNMNATSGPVGIHPNASLTADGTVFFGGRGARFGTTNDFSQAAFDGLSGTGRVVISHMRLRIGQNNGSSVFSGTLLDDPHGYGHATNLVVKAGTGTWTLAGAAAHSGGTIVSNGTLRIDGLLRGNVTVAGGATLAGSGTVALHVGDAVAEQIVCDGTLDATHLKLAVRVDAGTRGTSFILADCSDGTLAGGKSLVVQAPTGWTGIVEPERVLLRKALGSVVVIR